MSIRNILVLHSIHRQCFQFPLDYRILHYVSWDGIPQALAANYNVKYIPITEVAIETLDQYDLFLILFDDIYRDFPILDELVDRRVMLLWSGCTREPELSLEPVELEYLSNRLPFVDIVFGVTHNDPYAHFFTRADAILSNIVNPIDFGFLYAKSKELEIVPYNEPIAVMPHVIEPYKDCNWSQFLLSMKILNSLGYKVVYQSRVNKETENMQLTQSIKQFDIDVSFMSFLAHEDYFVHLSKCKLMFELRKYDMSASMAIIVALFAQLPSMGSPSWYQNVLFPDLVIEHFDHNRIIELHEMLQGSFRQQIIEKGYELARSIDVHVVAEKLHNLIEGVYG